MGVSSLLGLYYYTYSTFAIVAGASLDRLGAKYVIPAGIVVTALGSILFGLGSYQTAEIGRLLQGAGAAFAFTGAVYLASHGFSAAYLATAIGFTQMFGMLGRFGRAVRGGSDDPWGDPVAAILVSSPGPRCSWSPWSC